MREIRQWMKLIESVEEIPAVDERTSEHLPDDVIQAFEQLGHAQRGEPEVAMLAVQQVMGGGVLSMAVEHVGDITHRMSHMVRFNTVLGAEKIHKTYKWLISPYGFEREMKENIISNAKYRDVPLKAFRDRLTHALRAYASAHAKLTVYNKAQWLAREAAVAVGLEDFDQAKRCLHELVAMSPSESVFAQHAMEYHRDDNGVLQQYKG